MSKLVSEDSAQRAFQGADEKACGSWLREHLQRSYGALLEEPWILDAGSSVKPLYGRQQGAKRGDNPGKPGRPSHIHHTYFVANLRLLLEVEMQPGRLHMRSRSCGSLSTAWRPGSGRRCCAAISAGERSG